MRKLKKDEQISWDGWIIGNPCSLCGNTGIRTIEVGPASAQWREEACHFCGHRPTRPLTNSGNPTWK